MKQVLTVFLTLIFSLTAFAGQLKFNYKEDPICYFGNPKTALAELLKLDYDPVLSNGRLFPGSRDGKILLYAEQIDENGWLSRKFVLPPCN